MTWSLSLTQIRGLVAHWDKKITSPWEMGLRNSFVPDNNRNRSKPSNRERAALGLAHAMLSPLEWRRRVERYIISIVPPIKSFLLDICCKLDKTTGSRSLTAGSCINQQEKKRPATTCEALDRVLFTGNGKHTKGAINSKDISFRVLDENIYLRFWKTLHEFEPSLRKFSGRETLMWEKHKQSSSVNWIRYTSSE